MNRSVLREKAKLLRVQGKTFYEIQDSLHMAIPKATLSGWFKDVVLPKHYQEKVQQLVNDNLQKGRIKAREILQRKRELLLESFQKENRHLTKLILNKDIAKVALAMLYLGEGSKWKAHRGLMLGSSEPLIVLFYIKLLEHCYDITREELKCRVSYRADQDIEALESYWSDVTGISKKDFYKTKPDPRTIGKKTTNQNYKGVCVVSCRGTEIQLELEQISILLNMGL